MSRAVSLLGGLLCLGLAGASGYWASRTPAARTTRPQTGIAVEPEQHDFGMVAPDQVVTATFRVVNHGPGAVTLADPMKSCTCASAVLDRRELAPGEAATLTVHWRTAGKDGRTRDTVALQYSSAATFNQPVVVLMTLAGTVRPSPIVSTKE